MNNYLCANRHHFRAPTPVCPTPGCTAEVRHPNYKPFLFRCDHCECEVQK